jgi:hypothetical protein
VGVVAGFDVAVAVAVMPTVGVKVGVDVGFFGGSDEAFQIINNAGVH